MRQSACQIRASFPYSMTPPPPVQCWKTQCWLVGREVSRGEKMALRRTDPESYFTEYTLAYEDECLAFSVQVWTPTASMLSEHGTHKTVKARNWPWRSGESPQNLLSCSLFARKRWGTLILERLVGSVFGVQGLGFRV